MKKSKGYQLLLQYEKSHICFVENIFISAVAQGNIDKLQQLRKSNNEISSSCLKKALYYAAKHEKTDVLQMLANDPQTIVTLGADGIQFIDNIKEQNPPIRIIQYLNNIKLLLSIYISLEDNWETTKKLVGNIPHGDIGCIKTAFDLSIYQRKVNTVIGFLEMGGVIQQEMINSALVTRCKKLNEDVGITDDEKKKDKQIIKILIPRTNRPALFDNNISTYTKNHKLEWTLRRRKQTLMLMHGFYDCVHYARNGNINALISHYDTNDNDINQLIQTLEALPNDQDNDVRLADLTVSPLHQAPYNQDRQYVGKLQQPHNNQRGG